jgi:hypothetical protein
MIFSALQAPWNPSRNKRQPGGRDPGFGKGKKEPLPARAVVLLAAAVLVCLAILSYSRNLDYRTEVSLWTSAVQVDPRNPRAHLGLGSASLREGRLDLAEPSFLKASQLSHPGRDVRLAALNNLAVLSQRLGQREKAVARFREILILSPGHQAALYNLSLLLLEGEEPGSSGFEEGSRFIKQLANTLPPSDPRLLTLLAIRSLRSGRWSEALGHLSKRGPAGLTDPGTLDLWADLLAGTEAGGFSEALLVIKAMGIDPMEAAAAAAHNLRSRGKVAESRHTLDRAASILNRNP